MENGFIKLHRKLINWEWFSDSKTFHVFMYLLLDANHIDNKWRGILVKRGQTLTGRIKISEATGLSQQNIRTCLDKLKSTNEISIEPTNKYSIITICNYDEYQKKMDDTNQQLTINQPATNQQLTTNKNEKKEPKQSKTLIYGPEIKETVAYFNEKTGKNCRPETKEYSDKISALLNNGYVVPDFVKVIDLMFDQWAGDIKMEKHLTIPTLFRASNFDKYLNSSPIEKSTKSRFDDPRYRN